MGSGGKRRGRRAAGDNKAEARGPKLQETWGKVSPTNPANAPKQLQNRTIANRESLLENQNGNRNGIEFYIYTLTNVMCKFPIH